MTLPTHRVVRVEQVMGTVLSVHVHLEPEAAPRLVPAVERAIDAAVEEMRLIDRLASTYRDDSEVRRIADGRLRLEDAHPLVRELATRSAALERATGGLVSAGWRGPGDPLAFDPTGIAKGWAVERAVRERLVPLLEAPGAIAAGMGAGGDLQLATAAGADWSWRIGIADPRRPEGQGGGAPAGAGLLAVVDVVDGAVATSGTAERGAHIIDPRTGLAARGALAATVVADGLTEADAWATAAVVAGADDLGWIAEASTRCGLVVAPEGRVRRWSGPAEVVGAAAA
ncbi:FAD:protein FMN transferase [Agrococcus sp. SL85]|uniref:FAD:protein FMN transferase n=1 Tax=Agrococcus sp. SL85 TaxID=2995141 RepID=UPI00226D3114|nr:FAD:protein FMN transferase [Agrococcus sp. SL85]WAC66051.1 FAD:protein FMN transferase [Agrococcus sp. SL85]